MLGRHLLQRGVTVSKGTIWDFSNNNTFKVPASGNYKITLVGAGGKGGNGSSAKSCGRWSSANNDCLGAASVSASAGGGGGSGETVSKTVYLKAGNTLNIVVGLSNSAPTEITGDYTLRANGGYAGSNAVDNSQKCPNGIPVCRSIDARRASSGYGGAGGSKYNPGGKGEDSGNVRCGGPTTGGSGGVSTFGGNVGRGGNGGGGKGSGCSGNTSGPWNGGAGYAGICRIEYLGR